MRVGYVVFDVDQCIQNVIGSGLARLVKDEGHEGNPGEPSVIGVR